MLVVFGVLQAMTNVLYAALAVAGHSYPLLGVAVAVDNITGAMGTAAFVGFQMSVTSRNVSATQLALMTSLTSLGQRVFGPFADDVVTTFDPHGFHQLVSTHTSIVETVQTVHPHLIKSVMDFDLGRMVQFGQLQPNFEHAWIPGGNALISNQDWSYFFIVTALMAIPGILLAVVVGRLRERSTSVSESTS
jgi:hypothetical protein